MIKRFNENNNFFNWIVFVDETTFALHGSVNQYYWSDENAH